jgi:hypothetical protein
MKKWWIFVSILLIIIIIGVVILVIVPTPTKAPSTTATSTPAAGTGISDHITVDTPAANAQVQSPLNISGNARGSWYFEGTAPAALLDSNGSVIAQGTIVANGDWTTTDFVPFTGSLTFDAQPTGSTGTLVLTNDNPSGDPSKQLTLDIPVTF